MRSSRAKVMTQKSTESFIKDMKPERSVRKDYAQLHNGNFDNMGPSSPGTPKQSKEAGKKRKSPGSGDSQIAGPSAKKPRRSLKVKSSPEAAAQDDQAHAQLAEMLVEFYEVSSNSSANSPRGSGKDCNGPAGAADLYDEEMACAEVLVEYSSDREGAAAWQEELKAHLQFLMDVDQEVMKASQQTRHGRSDPLSELRYIQKTVMAAK